MEEKCTPRLIGPSAFLVLLAIDALPRRECYGLRIYRYLKARGQDMDSAAVYMTLHRLRDRKILSVEEAQSPSDGKRTVTLYDMNDLGKISFARAKKHFAKFKKII